MLPLGVRQELEALQADRASGATALGLRAITLLRDVSGNAEVLRQVALAICFAQPAIATLRTACAVAVSAADVDRDLAGMERRLRRANEAIARAAVPLLQLRRSRAERLRIVTCSRSSAVEHTLLALHQREPTRVCCSESRPAREGVDLSGALAAAGLEVTLYSDAGISSALPGADAMLVGADAVARDGFINKVGTAALCALARFHGVPVVVLAGREKVLPQSVFDTLSSPGGPAGDVAADLTGIRVETPYFERVPSELLVQLVTDGGQLEVSSLELLGLWTGPQLEKYEYITRS